MKYVFTAYHADESGFSFISVFVSLTILVVTLPFMSYVLQSIHVSSYYEDMSVQQFFHFLQDEVFMASDYDVKSSRLELIDDDETITFELFGTNIRRQVNGAGQDIYLRDVKNLMVTKTLYGCQVVIITLTGGEYEKNIRFDPA